MMVGYKITDKGMGLLQAYVTGVEFIWIPGVNYDRLTKMALVLNKITFYAKDGYFSLDPDLSDPEDLLAVKALEMDGYIERSRIPGLERYLKLESFKAQNPGRFFPHSEEDI